MNDPILFSIVIPTYNRAHIIATTIESILAQTYTNYEVIIVDDGSTDNTAIAVQRFLSSKIHYYKKTNAERAAARNFGSQIAKGLYINWFDSDDIMFADHLQRAADSASKFSKPEIFTQGYQYQDMNGEIFFKSHYSADINQNLYKGNQLIIDSVFVRKDIALANPFNEDRNLSGSEDFELWLRIGAQYKVNVSTDITVAFIYHLQRSIIAMTNPDQLIKRYTSFINYTTSNPTVTAFLGNNIGVFKMKNYLLLAVDLALNNHLEQGVKYLRLAFSSSLSVIFERGFYAFLKHYIRHTFA